MTPTERKERTEELLREKGIPYNSMLPYVGSEEETRLRTPEEVGIRMFCLICVIGRAFDRHDESYRQFLEENNLWDHLTPEESSFMTAHVPEKKTALILTWRVEAMFLLMWAVQLFETLPLPLEQTNTEEMLSRIPSFEQSPWPFIRELKLRPKSEILDACDLVYRLHWATMQAHLDGKPPPANLDPDVVYEWHYAVNWLTYYDNSDWDDVSTDT